MKREPRIAERIRDVVRDRLGRDVVTPEGDVVSEELEGAEDVPKPKRRRKPK